MRERQDGSIIFIISVAALHASLELPMYSITKAADYALARNLAAAWDPDGIRVQLHRARPRRDPEFARVLYEDPVRRANRRGGDPSPPPRPADRHRRPGAAARPAPAGAFITGQILTVDGGTTIQSR